VLHRHSAGQLSLVAFESRFSRATRLFTLDASAAAPVSVKAAVYPRIFVKLCLKIMVTLEQVTAERVQIFKAVRLRALKESPRAFGSTFAEEIAFPEQEWVSRAMRWNGETGIGYLAMEDGAGCGIVGAFLDAHDTKLAHLISMWAAPTHRRRGVGQLLVSGIIEWAAMRGAHTVRLMVVCVNETAISFYKRMGFVMTGRTEPYPNDPGLVEYEMTRSLR
jgi:ribosomal protein S18 acetylase RimI-like enzyme